MIIYKITNKLNGRCYIGQTSTSLKIRYNTHCNKSQNTYIARSIRKYGKEKFSIEELARYATKEDLNNAEEYFISFYNCRIPNGYNISLGGNNDFYSSSHIPWNKGLNGAQTAWNKGLKMSEEARKNMSLAHKGKPRPWRKGLKYSIATLLKMSKIKLGKIPWNKGVKMSEEFCKKVSSSKMGKSAPYNSYKRSVETKKRMSISAKKRWSQNKEISFMTNE